jgi:three-Cys-motif partner protein
LRGDRERTAHDPVGDRAAHACEARDPAPDLEAWTPILATSHRVILYVDGFAGPGAYAGGEEGSPIIALKAALQHQALIPPETQLRFLFIEQDEYRAAHLDSLVKSLSLPKNVNIRISSGGFEARFREVILDKYIERRAPLPPTFAFIDPFGFSQTPFELVKTILSYPSCEVLINFMYEEVNCFLRHEDHPDTFDRLFGTQKWRDAPAGGVSARRSFLHDLYVEQLRASAKARYVRSFEMRNDNDVTDYFLFFATNNKLGIKEMKGAMWSVDQTGEFRFSDATNQAQMLLFGKPNYADLHRRIVDRFVGSEATVDEIEEFVLADTPFRETHYKRQVLAKLEASGDIEVVAAPLSRRKNSFPAGLRYRFPSSR